MTVKIKGGRPKAFSSVQDIESKIQNYKDYLKKDNKPPTMAGLAYYLGIDRRTLYNYKKNDEYFPTIKKYRDWILLSIEENCAIRGHGGAIFLAKNYGYTDRQEVSYQEQAIPTVIDDDSKDEASEDDS